MVKNCPIPTECRLFLNYLIVLDSCDYNTTIEDKGKYNITAETREFSASKEVEILERPGEIKLVHPDKSASNISIKPTLKWRIGSLSESYVLHISTDINFSNMIVSQNGISDTTFTPSVELKHDTEYYWRVKGVSNTLGEGEWSDTLFFTTIIEKPGNVILQAPDSATKNIPIQPNLIWNSANRAERYVLELSKDNSFSNIIQTIDTAATSVDVNELDYNTYYYWRVKAVNVGGESDFSTIWSFFTEYALPKVVLDSPVNQSSDVTTSPKLFWQPLSDANDYELLVATDSLFENTVSVSTNNQAKTTPSAENETENWLVSQQLNGLLYETDYFWKVRAIGEDGMSNWSDTLSFSTKKAPLGEIVELTGPVDQAQEVAIPTTLSWNSFANADTYDVQISDMVSFEDALVRTNVEGTETTVSDFLNDTTTYFWRVRANVADQMTEWSQVSSFKTELRTYDLAQPMLVGPADDSVGLPTTVSAVWESVSNASDYQLQVATDNNFVDLHQNTDIASESYQGKVAETLSWNISEVIDGLQYDTEYFWRVKATGPNEEESAWSSANSFTTKKAALGTIVSLTSPSNSATEIEIPVNLAWDEFSEAVSYDIEISYSSAFETSLTLSDYSNTTISISDFVEDTTTYFWRVRATVDERVTDWSEVWTFKTDLRLPETPEWSPSNNASEVSVNPLLEWGSVLRADSFDLQLSESNNFSEMIIEETGLVDTSYQVSSDLEGSTSYFWRIRGANTKGVGEWSSPLNFTTEVTTSLEDELNPTEFTLRQNYPNPFNPVTQIAYTVPEAVDVTLEVYSLLGQRVATLVNSSQAAGRYTVNFDASNLSSGIYLYKLTAGNFMSVKQMTLLK